MESRGSVMRTDKQNVYLAQREYDKKNNIGKYLYAGEDKPCNATLSDINGNRTNNGEQIFYYAKIIL